MLDIKWRRYNITLVCLIGALSQELIVLYQIWRNLEATEFEEFRCLHTMMSYLLHKTDKIYCSLCSRPIVFYGDFEEKAFVFIIS